MTILSASYTGSDRWYYNHYQDVMYLVWKYGKPTFFVTFMLDVNCPEVKRELKQGQTPYERPDFICCIFQFKKKVFMHDLLVKQVLGKYQAHINVIEFQKQGAPHCHILIWIENFDNTPHNIENFILDEIPNKEYDP